MFLADTDVVSELRKVRAGRADPRVSAWAETRTATEMHISAITLMELEHGVRLAERSDPSKGAILRQWLDVWVPRAFEGRVLPVDAAVARLAASFQVPDPAPFRDALIGATAALHGLTVATRNVRDFRRFPGVRFLDPWA